MKRALLLLLIVVDIALICLIVQTRTREVAHHEQYKKMVEDVEDKKRAAREYQGTGWGTIRGRIVFGGEIIPERKPIDMGRFKADADPCVKRFPLLREDWIIHRDNKGLRWTFVWLAQEPILHQEKLAIHDDLKKVPKDEVVVDTPCYAFVPHAVGLREGQTLRIKYRAGMHNLSYRGKRNVQFGELLRPNAQSVEYRFKAEEFPILLACNIHPWMFGWVGVFDHPYFAVSDSDGRFEVKQVPAGKYRLRIWHESARREPEHGKFDLSITIKNNEVTDIGDKKLPNKENSISPGHKENDHATT